MVVLGDQYRLDGVDSSSDDDGIGDREEDAGRSSDEQARHTAVVTEDAAVHVHAKEPLVNTLVNSNQAVNGEQAAVSHDTGAMQREAVAAMEAANEGIDVALRLEIAICSIQEGNEDALEVCCCALNDVVSSVKIASTPVIL